MEAAKDEFLKRFGDDYGYPHAPKGIDELRATEFRRLQGTVYLDHAGATLHSETQLEQVLKDLNSTVFGNPHSLSDSSAATTEIISRARQQVLDYFNASPTDYRCIFTSGATAALKLVGEFFPWSNKSCYLYTMENHNSVLGIREYALDSGATAFAVDIEGFEDRSDGEYSEPLLQILKRTAQRRINARSGLGNLDGVAYNLFAFPSECNFSGTKFPLQLVNIIKDTAGRAVDDSSSYQGHWMVLIDAAKGCATDPPDLARYPADFVVLSFYKIFGYPTGLGALLVRNEAAKSLKKTYFSGGTVSASIADVDFVKRRESIEQWLEDGTTNFLSVASLSHGFKIIDVLSTSAISRHTRSLVTYVRDALQSLKHENGKDVCTLYGRHNLKNFGPTIAFNLRRIDGTWIGYREVEKLASLSGIQLRTGCFCNPGACAKFLGLSQADLNSNIEAGHVCWDDYDVLNGKPTGAVRISFGYMSTFEDAQVFLRFVDDFFVSKKLIRVTRSSLKVDIPPPADIEESKLQGYAHLKSIIVYPVKSCAGFSIKSWPLSETGLEYDREWLLKGRNGEILTQKKVPAMCHIHTFIDLGLAKLYLESPYCKERLEIPLHKNSMYILEEEIDVYGQRYMVQCYRSEVNMWFTEAVGRPCYLVRCSSYVGRDCRGLYGREDLCRDVKSKLSFVNEAQLLLISEESVKDLNHRLNLKIQNGNSEMMRQEAIDVTRFRPNLVISGAQPYAEDSWRSLQIGIANFISLGGCNRCQMVNIDPRTEQAHRLKEPLATLASYRREKGKILFGILLRYENLIAGDGRGIDNGKTWISVGQSVSPF